ncbi:MAG TPA: glycine cleavage system protein H [Baekduia sp.]|nr:glycine cleavage system protein H [Baekduia sp.]
MQVHAGCAIPEEVLYSLEHDNWVRLEDDGSAVVGMTDVAQSRCGKLVSLTFKRVGRRIARGRTVAVIESAKWVGPFPAPVSGTLLATNGEAFAADPLLANRDPYGAGWLARIAPDALDDERPLLADGLVAFHYYRELLDREGLSCMRCAD